MHHAYGFAGDVDATAAGILGMISKDLGIAVVGNPDFFYEKFETLTIEHTRRIQDIHAEKAFSDALPRVFLIELYGMTREAQNALLKIIEEPRPGNHFFLVMPSFDLLLPTLRSRLNLVSKMSAVKVSREENQDGVAFLKKSLAERIAFVDDLAAQISDGAMTKHEAVDFLNKIESSLYADTHPDADKSLVTKIPKFEAIALARNYMNDRAPSVKILLEYVALCV